MTYFPGIPSPFTLVDTSAKVQTGDIMLPFAYDEISCRRVGLGAMPIIHLWRHQKAVVLGIKDRRLSNAAEAIQQLGNQGYSVGTRNSGGAAVPLDAGVLNISFIFPKKQGALDFHPDFRLMVEMMDQFIQFTSTAGVRVHQGEVAGSYCPGQFDLSIEGKKFCGIAQRRQTKAFIVQGFILVEGSGQARAGAAKAFYDKAAKESNVDDYPDVRSDSMGSLQETAGIPSVEAFVHGIRQVLSRWECHEEHTRYNDSDQTQMQQMMAQLRERYHK
ncbi:MAG TPA: biotin--protein ligase [Bacilli bacterium]